MNVLNIQYVNRGANLSKAERENIVVKKRTLCVERAGERVKQPTNVSNAGAKHTFQGKMLFGGLKGKIVILFNESGAF